MNGFDLMSSMKIVPFFSFDLNQGVMTGEFL